MTLLHRYVSRADPEIADLFRCKPKRCWHWSLEYGKPRRLYFAVQRDPARISRFAGVVMLGCLTVHARTRTLVGLGMALEHISLGMQSDGPILVRDDRGVVRWTVYTREVERLKTDLDIDRYVTADNAATTPVCDSASADTVCGPEDQG